MRASEGLSSVVPRCGVRTFSTCECRRSVLPMHGMANSSLIQRIFTGDGMRRTRLHTQAGDLIDPSAVLFAPQCLWSVVLMKLGHRQQVPWLGFRVTRRLKELIRPDWKILEFGSGMSSLFFASRCSRLVSVESDPAWYGLMRSHFAEKNLANIDYRHQQGSEYTHVDDLPDGSFDLALIDGLQRDEAARTAIRKCRPGGWILMDNTDVQWEDHKVGRAAVIDAAVRGSVEIYRDLYPFGLQACESVLVRKREIPS
jgi:hypothetical protein